MMMRPPPPAAAASISGTILAPASCRPTRPLPASSRRSSAPLPAAAALGGDADGGGWRQRGSAGGGVGTAVSAASTSSSLPSSEVDDLLSSFWYSRGVFDPDSRSQLCALSKQLLIEQRGGGAGAGGRGSGADDALSLLGPAPFSAGAAAPPPAASGTRPRSPSSDLFAGAADADVWSDFYAAGGGGGGSSGCSSSGNRTSQPLASVPSPAVDALPDSGLPGLSAVWSLDGAQQTTTTTAASTATTADASTAAVREAARRLLALHALLGGGEGADVVHMVAREPGLLAADPAVLAARLLRLRVAVARLNERLARASAAAAVPAAAKKRGFVAPWEEGQQQNQPQPTSSWQPPAPPDMGGPAGVVPQPGRAQAEAVAAKAAAQRAWGSGGAGALGADGPPDAVKLVVRQPALLLSPLLDDISSPASSRSASASSSFASSSSSSDDAATDEDDDEQQLLLAAWEFGLARDADSEWLERFRELEAYRARHGDCGAGFREGDDAALARWCSLQRAVFSRGGLAEERREALEQAGFVFDADEAEWRRWFLALARFRERHGHSSPGGLTLAAMGGGGGGGKEEGGEGGDGNANGEGGGETLYLANWCSVQRVAKRCRVLSEGREAMLASLEFDFSGADPLS